jgi:hypothetical protein
MLNGWERVYERVRRKGLANNRCAQPSPVRTVRHVLCSLPCRREASLEKLKTATFSVAKQRLPETLRDHRSKIESLTAFAEGKMTVGKAGMSTPLSIQIVAKRCNPQCRRKTVQGLLYRGGSGTKTAARCA